MSFPIVIHRYCSFFGDYVPWYAIAVGIALAVMAIGLYFELPKHRYKSETSFLLCFPMALIFGVILACVFDAVFRGTWRTWLVDGDKQFGFVFLGWAIGVLMFAAIGGRCLGLGARYMLDFYAPLLAVGQAIGRIGCFLGGCCYGIPSAQFGVHYPKGSLPNDMCGDIGLLPIQLIESAWLFCVFVMCKRMNRRYSCVIYLVGMSAGRFCFEMLRYDRRGSIGGIVALSPSQILSATLLLCGLLLFIVDQFDRKSSVQKSSGGTRYAV